MAPNRGRNRASEFDKLAATGPKDFDPEEDLPIDDSDAESLDDIDETDGREHYAAVGKSKLRRPKEIALGPQYRGAKISRHDLEAGSDDEDVFDSENDDVEGDEDHQMDSDDMTEGTDFSDEEEEEGKEDEKEEKVTRSRHDTSKSDAEKELAAIKKDSQRKAISMTLSEAGRLDAEKGRAVKRQRTAFDSLLNTRMKLQKSLIASNTIVGISEDQLISERADAQKALDAAEIAAFDLWNALNSFREDFKAAKVGKKRKRVDITVKEATAELWRHTQAQDEEIRPTRDAVLKKWSQKTQGPSVQTQAGRLTQTAQATIIDVIQEQLGETNADRLLKRVHAPRSCAPLQVSQRVTEDTKIYDDADFYGLLLKELLEQKSADSVATSNIDLGLQMRRENKTKKNVDTKASKGRKLRYTVHEKLQNFMAPEDRTTWGDRQSDELFSSLFGQRVTLGEQDEEEEDIDDGVGEDADGIMLFGR